MIKGTESCNRHSIALNKCKRKVYATHNSTGSDVTGKYSVTLGAHTGMQTLYWSGLIFSNSMPLSTLYFLLLTLMLIKATFIGCQYWAGTTAPRHRRYVFISVAHLEPHVLCFSFTRDYVKAPCDTFLHTLFTNCALVDALSALISYLKRFHPGAETRWIVLNAQDPIALYSCY